MHSGNFRSQPFANPGPMPERWESYATIGKQIDGLHIVACRVPLKRTYLIIIILMLKKASLVAARYFIVRRGYEPEDAIAAFNKTCGCLMERANYLADFNARIREVCPNPFPLFKKRDGKVKETNKSQSTPSVSAAIPPNNT
ncbi:hypothetical protein DAPPUDRAFT_329661 [Daphnia pulex]|uniref:Uncharacterized protein n=1 Tax=Daphnia pulex TaxID=6669 RepID=E9HHA1_DAPPU|nr:hypothetical protein DAPPUDRAFT_329661 [Daphnia pulex]|eukprot:EFX68827.1 hypothetical protein DAPPUDRAFT_329661 [Daphnia pulex]